MEREHNLSFQLLGSWIPSLILGLNKTNISQSFLRISASLSEKEAHFQLTLISSICSLPLDFCLLLLHFFLSVYKTETSCHTVSQLLLQLTDPYPIISRQQWPASVHSGSNFLRREAEPEASQRTLGRTHLVGNFTSSWLSKQRRQARCGKPWPSSSLRKSRRYSTQAGAPHVNWVHPLPSCAISLNLKYVGHLKRCLTNSQCQATTISDESIAWK